MPSRGGGRAVGRRRRRAARLRAAAVPSPYGFSAVAIAACEFASRSSVVTSATIVSSSVPTSRTVPAATASGRSVVSRMTSTGVPRLGASSCTPPESERITCASAMSRANSP